MNRTELKNDFYKRFCESDDFLVFSKTGLLCTLMGHSEIEHAPFISCTLSMCVRAIGRRLNSDIVKLENTQTGTAAVLRLGDPVSEKQSFYDILRKFSQIRPFGAQILYDSTIAECFSTYTPMRMTILNTLLKISGTESTAVQKALICAKNGNEAIYSALTCAKKGWCSITNETNSQLLPLPLTGYRLLAVQTNSRSTKNAAAVTTDGFKTLRKIYPHVKSFTDLNYDMLDYSKSHLKHTQYDHILHILSENERINSARAALKGCRIKEFAEIINSSQRSIERLWECAEEHSFLCECMTEIPECICARQWDRGIIAVIDENSIDYVINLIRRSFNAQYGYNPIFCVCDTESTE